MRSEEKLPIQVGLLDGVHVGDGDLPRTVGGHAHHGQVLEHFAPDRSSSDL